MRNVESQSPVSHTYPLTYGQRALWFLQQLSPENAAYNVMLAASIRNSLDVPALKRAWQALLNRHPSLRITVTVEDGQPVQRAHDNLNVHFERIDASHWSADELRRRIAEEAHKPFNLEQGPVTRIHLFHIAETEHVILMTVHHMVIDSRSLVLLMDELGVLYGAEKNGTEAVLPPLALAYADYVDWQARLLEAGGAERERLWTYWRTELGGELPELQLPSDRPRPLAQTFNGDSRRRQFDVELASRLKALAEAEGVTLYVLFLAAFQVLLHRYTGQADILVGATATGRSLPGLEGVVGFFHNSIVLRADLSGGPTFQSFLRQVDRTVAAATEHQEYPFPLLVEQLQPTRDQSRSPLFQVMFGMYRLGEQGVLPLLMSETGTRIKLGELELESFALEQRVAMLDLTLTIIDVGASVSASMQYNTDLFEAHTVERMLKHLEILLESIISNPAQRVTTMSLVDQEEHERLLTGLNDTGTETPIAEHCVHELFEEQVKKSPQSIAVTDANGQLTYTELNERANQLARYLQNRGVGPEVRVALLMNRSAELLATVLAVLKAGGAFVALDASASPERQRMILADAGAQFVLTEKPPAAKEDDGHGVELIAVNAELEEIARESKENTRSGASAENLAFINYTAGTSARNSPGVMVEHRGLLHLWAGAGEKASDTPYAVWRSTAGDSISISAIEGLWVVTRGDCLRFDVEEDQGLSSSTWEGAAAGKGIEFSLFYFASGDTDGAVDKYQLLLDGARFGDEHGFTAIWTPERHFHPFGGLYPNPSLTSAAIAAITSRIQIRAGSVVLPLHNPVRVAEEWSVVDNLSNGRVGLSVASGWHVNDFVVFAPENNETRKEVMFRDVETIRKLWRREPIFFQGQGGNQVEVKIFPRPIQRELPIWVTAFGSPETFRMAGEIGGGVLTHLQGQSLEVLEEKIAIYRRAWREHGHAAGDGHVTLMLHTYVGEDLEEVREKVRAPLRDYLKSSLDLIANLVESAGVEIDAQHFTEENMEALLSHAFNRYFETSGLFGTPDTCRRMIARLKATGVDEVACLVDFGVDHESVMTGLHYLSVLRERSNSKIYLSRAEHTPFAVVARPPKAQSTEPRGGGALALHSLMLVDKADERLTEQRFDGSQGSQIFSLPVTNTKAYVLDEGLQPVATGVVGELYLGGSALARGFKGSADLTAERFIPDPFGARGGERLYRTGERARYRSGGLLELTGTTGRNASAKRQAQATQAEPQQEGAYIEPRTEMERTIAGVWQDVLRIERPGTEDNFFDLGGDMLLLEQAHSNLQRRLARDIAMVELFQYPTISTLAHHLSDTKSEQEQQSSAVVAESRTRAETRRAALRQRQHRTQGQR